MAASGTSTMLVYWHAHSVSVALPGLRWKTAFSRRRTRLLASGIPSPISTNSPAARLRAVKDTVADDLVLVARIEALIVGHEMEEAVLRTHACVDAGANAILIHSRKSAADEILAFTHACQNRLPVVIVPTKYYRTSVSARIATVIWANHSMRAAMRQVCGRS